MSALTGDSNTLDVPAVRGTSVDSIGIEGMSTNKQGVYGHSTNQQGVYGYSENEAGVNGTSKNFRGVVGMATNQQGVFGYSENEAGVNGTSKNFTGVVGMSTNQQGVYGESQESDGVRGQGHKGAGVSGFSDQWIGTYGESKEKIGIYGKGPVAGFFEGNVEVTGNFKHGGDFECKGKINLTSSTGDIIFSDLAEDFDISETEKIEPGSVMVINQDGILQQSYQAYDKRVAGVISGAGNLRPGIILGQQQSQNNRMSIALVGKAYCKVDAQYSTIEVGDMLTTSSTPGYAMKAADPFKAFGAVIGKALRPLQAGQGMIPILIALQ